MAHPDKQSAAARDGRKEAEKDGEENEAAAMKFGASLLHDTEL